jgi:hypothetical protein
MTKARLPVTIWGSRGPIWRLSGLGRDSESRFGARGAPDAAGSPDSRLAVAVAS